MKSFTCHTVSQYDVADYEEKTFYTKPDESQYNTYSLFYATIFHLTKVEISTFVRYMFVFLDCRLACKATFFTFLPHKKRRTTVRLPDLTYSLFLSVKGNHAHK